MAMSGSDKPIAISESPITIHRSPQFRGAPA